jgi:hypothetical protein
MRHDEKPLGFECCWSAGGHLVIMQDQTSSIMRGLDKEPALYFQAEELPGLIESLRRAVGVEVIPDLQAEIKEQDCLINVLHEWASFPPASEAADIPPEKKKGGGGLTIILT